MPPQILRELFYRCVSPLRFLPQRFKQNIVEIAGKAALQFCKRRFSRIAQLLGRAAGAGTVFPPQAGAEWRYSAARVPCQ